MSTLIVLGGPIGHWWGENFEGSLAQRYRAGRQTMSDFLVSRGYLVYRPHEAFKGAWDDFGQYVNDEAVRRCKVFIDMTPFDGETRVPSPGTDHERREAKKYGAILISFNVVEATEYDYLALGDALDTVAPVVV